MTLNVETFGRSDLEGIQSTTGHDVFINLQFNRNTDGQTDRQTDRQTDKEIRDGNNEHISRESRMESEKKRNKEKDVKQSNFRKRSDRERL